MPVSVEFHVIRTVLWGVAGVGSSILLEAHKLQAHIKSALIGASVTIPIKDGRLATGTWQGIWYLEFRAAKHQRKIVATIQGEKK